jgi:hypothetical protein
MNAMTTRMKPECLARAGAISCRGCVTCRATGAPRAAQNPAASCDDDADFRQAVAAGAVGSVVARRNAKPAALVARDAATGLTGLQLEWAVPNVRAEFGHDFEAFTAFKKHEAAGDITICGATRNVARPATVASARGRKPLYTAEDWANPVVRREFADDCEVFAAYCQADARGAVNICQPKSQRF